MIRIMWYSAGYVQEILDPLIIRMLRAHMKGFLK